MLDFGTGSGCLAVTLAVKYPAAQLCALDISPEALNVAKERGTAWRGGAHRVPAKRRFLPVPRDKKFGLIVSNPPYIPTAELDSLQPEVRDFEPRTALDGGDDGLRFYRQLRRRRERC